jgi:acyl-CoA thioester hydrolase
VTTPLPSYAELLQLPEQAESVVWREHIDANGHMNIRHYLEFNALGTWAITDELGVDDQYRDERGMGLFTAEHHLRYYSELREGEKVSVHVRVLERSERSVHLMAFLVDRTNEQLSNTLEVLAVHVDLRTRRSVAMPTDIAEGFDRHIADSQALPWVAPVCGVMGIRR